MNKTSLVSGTIKGIQIVDLGLNQTGIKNSSKKYMIKLKKNKNSSINNSINNDSLISIKENISNKNTSISSKTKQTSSISSNQKIRKIKNNPSNKNTNKNFIKIKLNQKNNLNNNNNNINLPRPNPKKNILIYNHKEPKINSKLLSHSKSKTIKANTQDKKIRNTFNNKISENSNSNLNLNITNSKRDFNMNYKKMKSEPNTKRKNFEENDDFYLPIKSKDIIKDLRKKIKYVFKKILTKNSIVDAGSFVRSSGHNLEINSSVDSINYRKINKDIKKENKIIKKMRTNNKTYIISKDRHGMNKNNKNNIKNISNKNYNSNNIKNNSSIRLCLNNNNNNNIASFIDKQNINHHKIYNSNSLGTINDKYKSKNHKLRNLSNIKSSANELLNGTLVNISNKMNSTYNNNNNINNIKRINSSSKSKSKSKKTDNNIITNKNKRYQNKNTYIKSANKNHEKNDIIEINQSHSKDRQLNILMIKNSKNFYNNNNNNISHKEKEKNIYYNKKENIDCMKKIKLNNKSSQKKSQYINNNNSNMNKYKIIKKIKNSNNATNKIINLKNDIKYKSSSALNETGNNTYFHKSSLNPKHIYQNDLIQEKMINSPKHKGQMTTSNYDDFSFNKIISIQKIKINPKYSNSQLKNNDDKKIKKIISISCSIKNQKEPKQKIKVHRRQQSMINNNSNIINKNNKQKPQMINIDLQGEFLMRNKIKIKNSVKKFFNKEIPMPAKKIIKKYKKYLKQNELLELKQLHLKGEFVYYLGEILERINNKENTFAKVNQSFYLENENELNNKEENSFIINRSCENFRQGKDNEVKKLKNKFDNIYYNDEEGDYIIINGTHLNYRYEILECLGKGSFGEAIKCYDHKNKDLVCIKIINSQKKFQNQAMTEIKILSLIASCDINNDSNNVKFYNYFRFRNHICLVFELLGKNLYEYLQLNNFMGFDLNLIKNYTRQMLFSLLFLRNLGIIHCDLKPENILIFPNNASQVKVIDFGSSCLESERIYFYIQSRFYRAPEVIFDLGYNFEIDMWSLGCILYELYKGEPLFPGVNEIEQIYLIMEKIGYPPKYIIEHSPKKMLFFDDNLKPYQMIDEDGNYIIPGGKKIKDIMKDDPKSFVDFISKCLKWNPFERITPDKALMHPFIIENMNGAELYKHKLKVKHIKYGIKYNCFENNNNISNNNENEEGNNYNNVNSTRNKDYTNINLYQYQYQYYNKNSNYNKYTKEVGKYRGNSCQTKRYKNNNINTIKNSINNFNINNFEEIKYVNTTQNGSENDFNKKGNKKQSYSVTYGNSNGNNYCNMFNKKKKEKNLPLSTEIDENIRRINITENNEGGGGYKRMNKYKEKNNKYYKNKLPKHLPKKKSLGRIKNSNVKKQKNFYK